MRCWQNAFIMLFLVVLLTVPACAKQETVVVPDKAKEQIRQEQQAQERLEREQQEQEQLKKWLQIEEWQQTREYYLQQASKYSQRAAELEAVESSRRPDLRLRDQPWTGGLNDWISYYQRKETLYKSWADRIPHSVTLEQKSEAERAFQQWLAQQGTSEAQQQYLTQQKKRGEYLWLALRYEEMADGYEALGRQIEVWTESRQIEKREYRGTIYVMFFDLGIQVEARKMLGYNDYFDLVGVEVEDADLIMGTPLVFETIEEEYYKMARVREAGEYYTLARKYEKMASDNRSLRDKNTP